MVDTVCCGQTKGYLKNEIGYVTNSQAVNLGEENHHFLDNKKAYLGKASLIRIYRGSIIFIFGLNDFSSFVFFLLSLLERQLEALLFFFASLFLFSY